MVEPNDWPLVCNLLPCRKLLISKESLHSLDSFKLLGEKNKKLKPGM